jgi:hypothetical protein
MLTSENSLRGRSIVKIFQNTRNEPDLAAVESGVAGEVEEMVQMVTYFYSLQNHSLCVIIHVGK